MKLFIYNEESILNNPISRWVNVIIVTIITLIFIGNEAMPPTITYWGLAFIIIFSSLCISYCYSRTMSKTHFFEDDKRERDKKDKFSAIYILISSVLSCALAVAFAICYQVYLLTGFNDFCWVMTFIPIPILIFNLLNIPSLYYPLFEDALQIS
ncbi:hypothetical protein [uncultured Muribaculum sp.]|uniref:hypothetical protein n=1 Tax=uncultured Muribaculum sp. TaxID=1918613 RepID=UPI0025AEDFB2|nr:hypothetical protein [uncultured Muribaculum sp.]